MAIFRQKPPVDPEPWRTAQNAETARMVERNANASGWGGRTGTGGQWESNYGTAEGSSGQAYGPTNQFGGGEGFMQYSQLPVASNPVSGQQAIQGKLRQGPAPTLQQGRPPVTPGVPMGQTPAAPAIAGLQQAAPVAPPATPTTAPRMQPQVQPQQQMQPNAPAMQGLQAAGPETSPMGGGEPVAPTGSPISRLRRGATGSVY